MGQCSRKISAYGRVSYGVALLEIVLIFVLFFSYAGLTAPPDVNESHYLTKAKHFWDQDWCPGDLFLSSANAHWLFFSGTGWLTRLMPLPAYAWVGRIVTWALLAITWHRLSRAIIDVPGMAVFTALTFVLLGDRFHMAGEWVVGGFEAKGIAYAFVFLALEKYLKGQWQWVWPALGMASAWHVLVGGWAFACVMGCMVVNLLRAGQPQLRQSTSSNPIRLPKENVQRPAGVLNLPVPHLIAGFALALLGAVPAVLADWDVDPELLAESHWVYVHQRVAHHLLFGSFPTLHVARFGVMVVIWAGLAYSLRKHERVFEISVFCTASLLVALGGLLLGGMAEDNDVLARWATSCLRIYWFRLADVAIPMGLSLASSVAIATWFGRTPMLAGKIACAVLVSIIAAASGLMLYDHSQDLRPRADMMSLPSYASDQARTIETFSNCGKVCQWIEANTPVNAVFITPADQQTFKWYAGHTEVVCWKDIPQNAAGILQWRDRIQLLTGVQRQFAAGFMSLGGESLQEIAAKYEADYLVVPQFQVDMAYSAIARQPSATSPLAKLEQIYPARTERKSTYVVFRICR